MKRPFMPLTRGERRFLLAVCLVACMLGSLAGCAGYEEEVNAQAHGGVLEEDEALAQFTRIWEFTTAFAAWGSGTLLVIGVAPVGVRRMLRRRDAR